MRAIRVRWPAVPKLTEQEIKVLREVAWWQKIGITGMVMRSMKRAERLQRLGLLMTWPQLQAERQHGWRLTTLGLDVLRSLETQS